jgi:uncharacterized protein YdiU (UPF0061 family)
MKGAGPDNRGMNAPESLPESLQQPLAPAWREQGFLHQLGPAFAQAQPPQAVPAPHWVALNEALAAELQLADWLATPPALHLLAGNAAPPHGMLASAYSGHQFGAWAGQLGDGRALLLGEVDTPAGPMEVQLKGSGLTPYSRMGDGRAVLRSSIREYLCSEAMHALGIPTTRALAIVGSPLPVRREAVETAAVVTRVAPSFLRFGHFEHFAHTAQDEAAAAPPGRRHDGALLSRAARQRPALRWPCCTAVAERTASLLAQWQAVGFCHGVMNTDNMSLLGLTWTTGPSASGRLRPRPHLQPHRSAGPLRLCAPAAGGLLEPACAGAGLLPLIGDSDTALARWSPTRRATPQAMLAALRAKLGLREARDEDRALADDLLRLMAQDRCRLHHHLPPAGRLQHRGRTQRPRRCATSSSTAPPSTPGHSATPSAWLPNRAWMPNARCA